MVNLKQETLEAISENGKTVEDIAWIGCNEFSIPIDLFFELADASYDDYYGLVEVAEDLMVVFNDNSALYRSAYDGVEWWDFIDLNKPSLERDDITALIYWQVDKDKIDGMWIDTSSLRHMNSTK